MGKIALNYVQIQHNVDYSPGTGVIKQGGRAIQEFLVTKTLSGNVTITLNSNNSNINGQTCNVITFPATAFTVGRIYDMEIKKIAYANAGDQSDSPLYAIY